MNYKQFEDILFAEWRKRSVANGDGNELAPDGLLYRGRFVYNDGYWSVNRVMRMLYGSVPRGVC